MIWVQDGCYSTFAFVDFFFQSGCQASVLLHHLVCSLVPIIICILYLWIRVCRLGCVANLLGRGVYIHEVWCHYVWWAGGISHSFLYGGKHCVMWLYMKHVTIACLKSALALEFILSRFGSHWDCVRTRSLKSSLIVDFKYASRVDTLGNMFIVLYLCMVLLFHGYSLLAWILIQGHTPMYTMPFLYLHVLFWMTHVNKLLSARGVGTLDPTCIILYLRMDMLFGLEHMRIFEHMRICTLCQCFMFCERWLEHNFLYFTITIAVMNRSH